MLPAFTEGRDSGNIAELPKRTGDACVPAAMPGSTKIRLNAAAPAGGGDSRDVENHMTAKSAPGTRFVRGSAAKFRGSIGSDLRSQDRFWSSSLPAISGSLAVILVHPVILYFRYGFQQNPLPSNANALSELFRFL